MLASLDWIIVAAPVLLGVLGAWLSIQPPKRKAIWMTVLILLGVAATAATLAQIRQTRREDKVTRSEDDSAKKKLQDKIDALQQQVKLLSESSIPGLIGDVKDLRPKKAPLPDVSAKFVGPEEVAILIENSKRAGVAYQPKYGVGLVDLEHPDDFLRIPTTTGDFIRAGEAWGPNQFMGLPGVKNIVKPGDRIFGTVTVSCPTCATTRGYWVYIKAGDGGWYSNMQKPGFITNIGVIAKLAANFEAEMDALVPKEKRLPIQ